MGMEPEDVRNLPPVLQNLLKLECGSSRDVHLWRKAELRKKFQLGPSAVAYRLGPEPVKIVYHLHCTLLHLLKAVRTLRRYDHYSPPVRIAMLTEKILDLRRHLLQSLQITAHHSQIRNLKQ